MKRLIPVIIAVTMAFVMALMNPMETLASNSNSAVYISEFKVGMGKNASTAEAALEGYTIITDSSGKKVDFNDNAGGGWGSKGDKVVYIGYKTTSNRNEAITDIGLMNMKGGYKTNDYDVLMDDYLKIQIIPFVDSFIPAIKEYRDNYYSSDPENQARAQYIHDSLNKYTDDDCNDAPLGDLLLNETKYEMGDEAYNRLSDAEKAKHADIVTIIAQANGMATLAIENLLVRAADTEETTWIERLSETTYDDLLEATGLSLTKAKKEVDKLYYDDAMKILDMWDTFKEQLDHYDEAAEKLEELQNKDYSELKAIIDNYDPENSTEEQAKEYGRAMAEIQVCSQELSNAFADVMCREYLESIEHEDETLLDLFTMPYEDVEEDITLIYPMVASLSEGQRAGIELMTLQDLVILGATDENGYKDTEVDTSETISIYDNVDRGIYEKGGVGLTSDAIRQREAENLAIVEKNPYLSPLSYSMIGVTAGSIVAFGITLGITIQTSRAIKAVTRTISALTDDLARIEASVAAAQASMVSFAEKGMMQMAENMARNLNEAGAMASETQVSLISNTNYLSRLKARSSTCSKLSVGLGVAVIILIGITTYLSYRDLVNHYKVEFTPIPRYMVDEKDITAFNEKGEKIVIKNQSAYYKAVLCNRSSSAEYYPTSKDIADLNGDVGKQWLALYCAKNEAEQPILADSFKVVMDNAEIPAGYSTGIHMFGTSAAENLNNPLYVWNSGAKSIFVYFKRAEGSPKLTASGLLGKTAAISAGSGFSAGKAAISAGVGFAVGALAAWFLVSANLKKKRKKE